MSGRYRETYIYATGYLLATTVLVFGNCRPILYILCIVYASTADSCDFFYLQLFTTLWLDKELELISDGNMLEEKRNFVLDIKLM